MGQTITLSELINSQKLSFSLLRVIYLKLFLTQVHFKKVFHTSRNLLSLVLPSLIACLIIITAVAVAEAAVAAAAAAAEAAAAAAALNM